MKPKIIILTLLVLMALAMIPVQAGYEMTLTMSNPSGIAERDVLVYFANGSLQGFYNSTSVITLDTNESYIMAMRPMQTNFLEDPGDWLDTQAIPFLQTYYLYIAMMIFLAAIWLGRK